MKLISILINLRFICLVTFGFMTMPALASWTTVPNPSVKADKASAELRSLGKNISIGKIVKLSEEFVSNKDYEKLMKDSQKAKNIKIENLLYGDNFFYLKSGPIKIVFKWIDKNNVAFKLNGHVFSYAEAAHSEVWQKKVLDVVKNYQKPKTAFSKKEMDFFNSVSTSSLPSKFVVNLGSGLISLGVLYQLFHPTESSAVEMLNRINWKSPWLWTGVAAVVITLIANHYYKKHKEDHENNKSDINSRLKVARANLAAAEKSGEENLVSYQQAVNDLETLKAEYDSTSDLGFFGFLFGKRIKKPALYNTIMDRNDFSSGGGDYKPGEPGSPTAPPGSGSNNTDGVY